MYILPKLMRTTHLIDELTCRRKTNSKINNNCNSWSFFFSHFFLFIFRPPRFQYFWLPGKIYYVYDLLHDEYFLEDSIFLLVLKAQKKAEKVAVFSQFDTYSIFRCAKKFAEIDFANDLKELTFQVFFLSKLSKNTIEKWK